MPRVPFSRPYSLPVFFSFLFKGAPRDKTPVAKQFLNRVTEAYVIAQDWIGGVAIVLRDRKKWILRFEPKYGQCRRKLGNPDKMQLCFLQWAFEKGRYCERQDSLVYRFNFARRISQLRISEFLVQETGSIYVHKIHEIRIRFFLNEGEVSPCSNN